MSSFAVGDKVVFKIGRGTAVGSVVETADGTVVIKTVAGKLVSRKADAVELAKS